MLTVDQHGFGVDAVAARIRRSGLEWVGSSPYDVNWQSGDVLLVDNVLAAHARRPYAGVRRVLVATSGAPMT